MECIKCNNSNVMIIGLQEGFNTYLCLDCQTAFDVTDDEKDKVEIEIEFIYND